MKPSVIAVVLASLFFAAPLCTLRPAQVWSTEAIIVPSYSSGFSLDVLVDGAPLPKISHNGQTYIEAPLNKDFDLRITCPREQRYLAVCSVDGLSIMNGRPASSADAGYIIENGSMTIPGYWLDDNNVAHFRFGDKSGSYAKLMGKPANVGVIGLKVFEEGLHVQWSPRHYFHYGPGPCSLQAAPQIFDYRHPDGVTGDGFGLTYGDEGCNGPVPSELPRTKLDSFIGSTPETPLTIDRSGAQANPGLPEVNHGSFIHAPGDNQYDSPPGVGGYYACKPTAQQLVTSSKSNLDHDVGTIFGSRTSFKTHDVPFDRGAVVASFAIEYASHEKLVKAGILPAGNIIASPTPNPFPADGCPPPPGWHG